MNLFRFFAAGKEAPLIKDQQLIDTLYKKYRLRVMLAVTVGYGFAYTCRLALSVVKKPLIDAGIFTPEQLGMIGSAIFYGYAFGKFTNGFLADHANLKRFLATGVFVSACLNIAMGWSTLLWVWVLLWGLNGWFQGFGAPSGAVALSTWFSTEERGRFYGIWSTAHSLGEGLTFFGVAALVSFFGWRAGFIGPGLFCVLVAGAIYFLLKDRPQTLGLPHVAVWKNSAAAINETKPKSTLKTQLSVLRLPSIWILGLASATMYMTRYAINSWGILYLLEAKGYSTIEAGSIIGLNTIAGLAGCVAYGFISDKWFKARRPPVTFIFGLIEVIALYFIFFGPPGNPLLLTITFVFYGFSLNGLITSLGGLFAIDIAPKKAAGAAIGFIGIFSYIGAGIQDTNSGKLIGNGTTMIDGMKHYDFSQAITFWLGASVVSLVLAAFLWRIKVSD